MSESNIHIVPPEVADAFQSAAITALHELTQVEAFPEPTSSTMGGMPPGEVVLAAMRLLRPVAGTMTLVLTAEMAAQLAARYLPAGTPLSDEMIDDVAGEFANVIAGQVKTILKGTPYHFTLSTPVVTRAESLAQFRLLAEIELSVTLASELDRVMILVQLRSCPNA